MHAIRPSIHVRQELSVIRKTDHQTASASDRDTASCFTASTFQTRCVASLCRRLRLSRYLPKGLRVAWTSVSFGSYLLSLQRDDFRDQEQLSNALFLRDV